MDVYKPSVLPVMTTFEAPIALATSKQTNPIGPVEREEINKMATIDAVLNIWQTNTIYVTYTNQWPVIVNMFWSLRKVIIILCAEPILFIFTFIGNKQLFHQVLLNTSVLIYE